MLCNKVSLNPVNDIIHNPLIVRSDALAINRGLAIICFKVHSSGTSLEI
jgi:hypothetical protein